ncbi:MAG: hypothetical protein AUI54_04160 [Acidobacteria bacterium 13_1_40CM_2_56_5]|nr:MAG: hypothetical protein AUI54_04160 [Acidobacteria bacterium 13_1_40CM_2_56_5]
MVLCYPRTVLIDAEGRFLRRYDDNLDLTMPSAADRFHWVLQNIGLGNVQYGLMRSDVLRHTSLFGNFAASDLVLIAELALYGEFREIPQDLFFRRMHDGAGILERKSNRRSGSSLLDSALLQPRIDPAVPYWSN